MSNVVWRGWVLAITYRIGEDEDDTIDKNIYLNTKKEAEKHYKRILELSMMGDSKEVYCMSIGQVIKDTENWDL